MREAALVSLLYCASVALILWVGPLQRILLPGSPDLASVFFLPHGVRVLAFLFFGWWAVAYLLPGMIVMWAAMALGLGQAGLSVWGSAVSLVSCLAAYEFARAFIPSGGGGGSRFSWQWVLAMGMLASLCNATGLTMLQWDIPTPAAVATYVVGDMLGLVALMLALMIYFRLADARRA